MLFHTCFSLITIRIQILSNPATKLSDIFEFLQKNESRNTSDLHPQDYMLSPHFGSISKTKSSIHFFLFTLKYELLVILFQQYLELPYTLYV